MAKGAALTPPLPARGERYGEGPGALDRNEPIKRKSYDALSLAKGASIRPLIEALRAAI